MTFFSTKLELLYLRPETLIREKYVAKQQATGHSGLFVEGRGLYIDKNAPLLTLRIDGEVNDPTSMIPLIPPGTPL